MSEAKAEYRTDGGSLMLKQVSESVGLDMSALLRYINQDGMKAYLGIEGMPAKYPAKTIPAFRFIADKHKAGELRPAKALARLKEVFGDPAVFETPKVSNSSHQNGADIPVSIPIPETEIALRGVREIEAEDEYHPLMVAAVRGAAEGRAKALGDGEQILTAKQAAELLQITERMLRRTHPPYRRYGSASSGDRWRRSDLLGD